MFVHKAIQRKSPDLLPMEFNTSLDVLRGSNNKPPTISQAARRAKADELLLKNNSNLRLVKIPQKIQINSKYDWKKIEVQSSPALQI